ncbi:MAG: pitrilysin family protein [Candidatus Omnitrophota bacterium]
MYKKTVLDNGLRIVTYQMPKRLTVSLGVWIGTGGRYENQQNKGAAHFLEHLIFKGSKKYSNRAIKESIEGVGGSLNGFTSEELTCYLAKVPSRYLNLSLSILSDVVLNPLLKIQDLEKERPVIMEEIRMYKDLPQHIVVEALDEIMWPDHPLGMSIAGTLESIGKMTNNQISGFKNNYYLASNIVIAACGALEHNKLVSLSKKIFTDKTSPKKDFSFQKVSIAQDEPKIKLVNKDIEQTHLAIGLHGLKRDHKDSHALGLLNVILGANMSSRLFHEVREKRGLAYAISSYVKRYYDTGAFVVHAGTDNLKFIETIEVILNELKKIKNPRVKITELNRAKEYYIGQLTMALEETLEHMVWIGESTMSLNKIYTFDQVLKEVKKIKTDDLLRVANTLFRNDRINLALVGPTAEKAKEKIQDLFNLD